jgi:hypothetical protein
MPKTEPDAGEQADGHRAVDEVLRRRRACRSPSRFELAARWRRRRRAQAMTGAVVSCTVTVKLPFAVLPRASGAAVHRRRGDRERMLPGAA